MRRENSMPAIICVMMFILLSCGHLSAQQSRHGKRGVAALSANMFPAGMDLKAQAFYRFRKDGKPGREVMIYFKGGKFSGEGTIEVECAGETEVMAVNGKEGIDSLPFILPAGAGVKTAVEAKFKLKRGDKQLNGAVVVPALRQWTVYIYPHSHVDIGYTNTQANVEVIHKRNLINGIELAKQTVNYPEGARYSWNPEVLWPVERYLKTAGPAQQQLIIDAVKKGYLHLDASYVNTNTSMSADEEMFEFFGHCSDMEQLTGTKINTMVQVDVPGMSWGIVPVAAQFGIKYILAFNNGSDRVGRSTDLSFRPFWWKSADGRSKVLFLQPGSYTPGAAAKGYEFWPKMAGQTDTSKLMQVVKTAHPRRHFVDHYLATKLPELEKSDYYPYDIFAMSWAMADNTPIDADLPEAVKSWNEEYAFPHLVIAGASTIMEAFEKKYGDQLPVLSGDFTEYWTDGLGAAAKQTSMNRNTKEKLIQDETLWTMMRPGVAAPRTDIKEAWRNVSMGTEHTWCYMDPSKQPITNDILQVKFGYFQKAQDISEALTTSALENVWQHESTDIGVFNTLSWKRSGLVHIPASQSQKYNGVAEEGGKMVPSQKLSSGELVFLATDVPAFGLKKYFLKEKAGKKGSLAKDNILDNGIVKLVIDKQSGDIASLTSGSGEFVDTGASCRLNSFRYLYGADNEEKALGTSNVKISVKENGPLLGTILVESAAEGCNSLTREITVIAGMPFVEIKNVVDKKAVLKKEGIHFGFAFNLKDPVIRADIPWGIMNIDSNQLKGANRNWIGFQRWLDITDGNKGVTWCSLDAPVFEVGNITANIIGSATNSEKWIKKITPSATIYSWALNNHWHTNFPLSQEGKIEFRYRILPYNTSYDAGNSNRFGLDQAQPLIAAPVKKNTTCQPLLSLEGSPEVFVSILKTDNTGNNTFVRIRSVSGKNERVKLHWNDRKPISVVIADNHASNRKEGEEEVIVPAMGFLTIEAKFGSIH